MSTTTTELLDCGHERVPRGMAYGTVHLPDGRVVCLRCGEQAEYESFQRFTHAEQAELGAYFAYIAKRPLGDAERFAGALSRQFVTTWTGRKLARVTEHNQTSAGFGGRLPGGGRLYFRAVDEQGRVWFGNSPGWGMYCRMRLLKDQPS